MTHELDNKISDIVDSLDDAFIKLNNIIKYHEGDLVETEKYCLKDALSSINDTIEMLYVVKD